MFGRVDPLGRRTLALRRLNALVPPDAEAELMRCLGAVRWARWLAEARPFADEAALTAAAERAFAGLGKDDWREAFAAHPRIGESGHGWARKEQHGVDGADAAMRGALADANRAYEAKFGWIFLICATGKSAGEMLAALETRMHNEPDAEFETAIEEQKKITRLRLEKLLTS